MQYVRLATRNRSPQGAWFLIRVYCVATHIVAHDLVKQFKDMRDAIPSGPEAPSILTRRFLFLLAISLEAAFEKPSAMLGRPLFYLVIFSAGYIII